MKPPNDTIPARDANNSDAESALKQANLLSQQARTMREISFLRDSASISTQLVIVFLVIVSLFLLISFRTQILADRELQNVRRQIEQEIDLLQREGSDLQQDFEYVRSDAYVESWAHGEGRMVRENERIVLPVSSQVTGPIDSVSQSTIENLVDLSQVETTLPKPEPWQVWWSLFFDLPQETTR